MRRVCKSKNPENKTLPGEVGGFESEGVLEGGSIRGLRLPPGSL